VDNFDEIARAIADRICGVCEQRPQQVWLGGLTGEQRYGVRCGCWPEPPRLGKSTSYAAHRREQMENAKTEPDLDIEGLF